MLCYVRMTCMSDHVWVAANGNVGLFYELAAGVSLVGGRLRGIKPQVSFQKPWVSVMRKKKPIHPNKSHVDI